jgi:hypothetical protein
MEFGGMHQKLGRPPITQALTTPANVAQEHGMKACFHAPAHSRTTIESCSVATQPSFD